MTQNDFSKILLSAVEESLSSLGDSSKQAIFFHLEFSFNIKKEQIPSQLTEFTSALETIFGPGASYIEKLIARKLHDKLGLRFEDQNSWNFVDSVRNIKQHVVFKGQCATE